MLLFPMNVLISFLEYVQPRNHQIKLYYLHSHIKLFNEFLLIYTHQD